MRMASKKLTDPLIRGLAKQKNRYEIADALTRGLYIAVEPTGTKIFVHRFSLNGKGVRLTLQPHYPALNLANARRRVQEQRIALEEGCDPRMTGDASKQEATFTFDALCVAYLRSRLARTKFVTCRNYAGELGYDLRDGEIVPSKNEYRPQHFWGTRAPQTLTKDEIKVALATISDQCGLSQADHIFLTLTRMFEWAERQDLPSPPVMRKIEAPLARKSKRQRLLTPFELAQIWFAAIPAGVSPDQYAPERDVVHWLILTGQRAGQATNVEFNDFNFEKKLWHVNGDKPGSKGVVNALPITASMQSIIDLCPHKSGYLFSKNGGRTPFQIGDKTKKRILARLAAKGCDFPHWTFHDFRRIYRSTLSSFPIPHADKVCELLIGHSLRGIEPVYNLYKYTDEKRVGMEAWEEWLRETFALYGEPEQRMKSAA
jgi:integrase